MGWGEMKDKELLALAQFSFDALLTLDKSLEFQQNLKKLSFGILVVTVPKNQVYHFEAIQELLLTALDAIGPGVVIHVPTP
jgi:hypothetical protein